MVLLVLRLLLLLVGVVARRVGHITGHRTLSLMLPEGSTSALSSLSPLSSLAPVPAAVRTVGAVSTVRTVNTVSAVGTDGAVIAEGITIFHDAAVSVAADAAIWRDIPCTTAAPAAAPAAPAAAVSVLLATKMKRDISSPAVSFPLPPDIADIADIERTLRHRQHRIIERDLRSCTAPPPVLHPPLPRRAVRVARCVAVMIVSAVQQRGTDVGLRGGMRARRGNVAAAPAPPIATVGSIRRGVVGMVVVAAPVVTVVMVEMVAVMHQRFPVSPFLVRPPE